MEIYVTELDGIYPKHYFVMVNGKVYDTLRIYTGHPLTFAQQYDIAAGYKEVLEWYVPVSERH